MQKEQTNNLDNEPKRTPGMAEGEESPETTDLSDEPGRTPGSAEGEEDVADKNLGSSK